MTTVLVVLFFCVGVLFGFVIMTGPSVLGIFTRWGRCECGRSRLPLYSANHPRSLLMAIDLLVDVLLIVGTIFLLLWLSRSHGSQVWIGSVAEVFFVLNLLRDGVAFWFHEKDKWKRLKDKVLGSVKINLHGRLVVAK